MTPARQCVIWISLWFFWVFVSRHNHPIVLLNCLATALMLTSFAAVIYMNWLVLIPRFWLRQFFFAYWFSLSVTACALTAIVVVLIQKVYDVLWGPDPLRFGFWINYGLDFTGMCVHLAAAALVVWLTRRKPSAT